MANSDVLPIESTNTSHFSASHSHPFSSYGHEESFPAVGAVVDQYIDRDIPSANARAISAGEFFIDMGAVFGESEGGDAKRIGIVKSQEALDLQTRYRTRMAVDMGQCGLFCNLANHIIGKFENSSIHFVRDGSKVVKSVCKSKRKPGIVGIRGVYVGAMNRLGRNHDERVPPVNVGAGQMEKSGREGSDGDGIDGNKKKDANCFVPRDWLDARYVAEFGKFNKDKAGIGDSASLSAPTLDLKRPIWDCPPNAYLAEDIDDLLKMNSFRWRTTFIDKLFKPANRICRVIITKRFLPLRYVKNVDHFKQAMREVVLVNHLVFSRELRTFHRDIDIHNLMVRYLDDKTLYGLLVDFDLATIFCEIAEDRTETRIRSRAFMSWELLQPDPPPNHLERFDWESFFYVISWIGCHYSEGKEINKADIQHWYESDDSLLVSMKQAWLFGPNVVRFFTPFYKRVALEWAVPLRLLFREGRDAKEEFEISRMTAEPGDPIYNENFDEVTMGGHVTWDRFWGILQK